MSQSTWNDLSLQRRESSVGCALVGVMAVYTQEKGSRHPGRGRNIEGRRFWPLDLYLLVDRWMTTIGLEQRALEHYGYPQS